MIRLKEFTIGFEKRVLLKDVNISLKRGVLISLIGRNGAGKSTFLRALAGLNPNFSGEILIEGENIKKISKPALASLISFVNTNRPRISNLKCRDIIALGRSPYTNWIGRLKEEDHKSITEALESVNMADFAEKYLDQLSDGESQRIMIARALAQDTPIIILDEPTSFLDLPNRYEIVALLRKIAHKKNKLIIFSTHELDIALDMSDRIALIFEEKIYNKNVTEMINSGLIQRLFHSPGYSFDRLFSKNV